MQLAKPDPVAVVLVTKPERFSVFPIILIFFGLILNVCLAFSATPPSQKANLCPDAKVTVNGQEIHRGIIPNVVRYANGTTRIIISPEMALTPLEMQTVAGFMLRAPANVLGRGANSDCDENGLFKWVKFNLFWHDGKLSPSAILPSPNSAYPVTIFAHLSNPNITMPASPSVDRIKAGRGPGTPLPKFGFTAYTRIVKKGRAERFWDTFVLNDVHGINNSDVPYLCEISESKLLNGTIDREKGLCEGGINIRNGLWLKIRFLRELLPDAANISEQIIKIMNSYIVQG